MAVRCSGGDAVRRAVGPVRERLLERVVGTGGLPALPSQRQACGAKKGNPTGGIDPPHWAMSSNLGEGGVCPDTRRAVVIGWDIRTP